MLIRKNSKLDRSVKSVMQAKFRALKTSTSGRRMHGELICLNWMIASQVWHTHTHTGKNHTDRHRHTHRFLRDEMFVCGWVGTGCRNKSTSDCRLTNRDNRKNSKRTIRAFNLMCGYTKASFSCSQTILLFIKCWISFSIDDLFPHHTHTHTY